MAGETIMSQLTAPNGKRIIGTSDLIPGVALISGATRNPDGTLELEWEGETTVLWDGQRTDRIEGERLYVDEEWNVWRESELTLTNAP